MNAGEGLRAHKDSRTLLSDGYFIGKLLAQHMVDAQD